MTTAAPMDFVYFVVLVGILVFVHELGHFTVAKLSGVVVQRFSLGFGPRLTGFRIGETEYVLAAIPLGGYVRMLGERPGDVIPEAANGRSFHEQPLLRRMAIVSAGPAMNLVLPLGLFFVVSFSDATISPAVIGTVFPGRPADGRLLAGDEVQAVDGVAVTTFREVSRVIDANVGRPLTLRILRRGQPIDEVLTPVLTRRVRELGRVEEVGRVGIMPHHPMPVVGVFSPHGAAAQAGLRTFDRVLTVAGQSVDRYVDLTRALDRRRGAIVPLTYLRPARIPRALGGLVELELYTPHVATLSLATGGSDATLAAGLEPSDLYVRSVRVGSAEQSAGLRPGDRIVALDGHPVRLWSTFVLDLQAGGAHTHQLLYRRGEQLRVAHYALGVERGVTPDGQRFERYAIGLEHWLPMRLDPGVPNPHRLADAVRGAFTSTREMVELTVLSVVRLLEGEVSMKSIGGPLTIFDVAGTAARSGLPDYLTVMAFISVNLGLINLLPIPMLDGGHLLFFLVEGVTRRRISRRVREYASLVGLVLLLLLMGLALKNDIERHWPSPDQESSAR